jgi:hypothetical protein
VTTLSRPFIELRGYGVAPLSSIRYDITNAAGALKGVAPYF